ncbi:sugar-binding protein [Paenibacillus sp. YN15]|uniref:sugar-binding protein n=1 Tax=Paenibacillus sp. YN15 TaxID=1742774 RepID=UPI000DCBF4F9|nr:sugar-binding protein [Paenibacillus sp. YN15]RAU92161.1 hypothetical protein DQG13_27985 [Paenibacillus sp. YN15]
MKKRSIVSAVISLMMVFALFPVYSFADEPQAVSVTLGENYANNGISAWAGDSPGSTTETVAGKSGLKTNPAVGASYIYFNVDNNFIYGGGNTVNITIEYFDNVESANSTFGFSYDSMTSAWDYNVPKTLLTGSNTWKTVTYTLNDANFANRENGADFRISSTAPVLFASVEVEKRATTATASSIQFAPDVVEMPIGTTKTVIASVLDQHGYVMNKAPVTYSSSNTAVATINSSGVLTAKEIGNAAIKAVRGGLTATLQVTVTDMQGPVSVTFGAVNQEYGMVAFSGDGAGRTIENYDGVPAWQTNPASGAHYIYFRVSDHYIYNGKNIVEITVDYYDAEVSGDNRGFRIAYDSVATAFAYTERTVLEGSLTWKQVTYVIDDAKFSNRQNNGADFRIETNTPVAFSKASVELIPSVSMWGEHVQTGSIFAENETVVINLLVNNQFDVAKQLNATYRMTNYWNNVVDSGQFTINLGANQEGLVYPLSLGTPDKGTYTVSIEAVSLDGIRLNENIHMGVIADLTEKSVHPFLGFNTHFSQSWSGANIRTPLVVQAGGTSIRDGYRNNDAYINTAAGNGLSTMVVTSTDLQWIENAVTNLLGKVDTFEIGNELSQHMTAADYFAIVQGAHAIIKNADPAIRIVGGVTLPYDEPWLKALVDLGVTNYLDAMSFHLYPSTNPEQGRVFDDFENLKQYIDNYHAANSMTKNIELMLTEVGWPTMEQKWGGSSELVSASYGAQLYVDNLAHDTLIDKMYWYDFLNDCTDSTFYECNQGVLYVDNAPKPSFVAFNNVANQLAGAVFVQSYNTLDNDVRIFKFHRTATNQDVLVIWSNVNKQIGLQLGSGPLQIADIFGNDLLYDNVDGITTLSLSTAPIYITGSFSQAPVLTGPAFEADKLRMTASPEEEVEVVIARSAGAELIAGSYDIELPLGWQLVSGGAFSANQAEDTLVFRAPAFQTSGSIIIDPLNASGDRLGRLVVDVQMQEPIVLRISPIVDQTGDGWELAVKLDNPSSLATMSGGTITITEPLDMAGVTAFAPTAPNSSQLIRIPAPSISVDTPLRVSLQVDRDDNTSWTVVRTISALTAVKTTDPIVVDGVIDAMEWNGAESFTIDQASQVRMIEDWGGPGDLSATAYAKWDEDHLYLAVRVTDDSHFNNNSPSDAWKGDSIQFTIDPGRSIEPGALGWNENTIALNSTTGAVMKKGGVGGNNLPHSNISIVRDDNEEATVYEMALKWTDILPEGEQPSSDTAIGFSFLANDNDGSLRRGWIEYMSGIGLTKDPTLFGDLIFTNFTSVGTSAAMPSAISLSRSSIALEVNDTITVQAAVYDQNNQAMTGITVSWLTSDADVAVVDASGMITAIGEGVAVVSAKYGNLQADVNVSVTEPNMLIIFDEFAGTNGAAIHGRSPDTANLPQGTWLLLNFPSNGQFTSKIQTGAGNHPTQAELKAGGNSNGAIAVPIYSEGSYAKPTRLRIQADLSFPTRAYQQVGLGYYSQLPQQGGTETVGTYFSGLRVDNRSGEITLIVNGQPVGSPIAYTGTWDPESRFLTLAYTIDTVTGSILNVSFTGSDSNYDFLTNDFTDAATAYAAVLIGPTFQRDHKVDVDNFQVVGIAAP